MVCCSLVVILGAAQRGGKRMPAIALMFNLLLVLDFDE
jgi:hypothetical protein